MRTIFLAIALFSLSITSYSQKEKKQNKVVEILLMDPAIKNLKTNYELMSGVNDPIHAFLERVVKDPTIITTEQFATEKKNYYRVVDNYNAFIDSMCSYIYTFDDLKDLRSIPLSKFRSLAMKNTKDIKQFVDHLGTYDNEALAFTALIPILVEAGKELYKYYSGVQIAKIKSLIITEIEKYKLERIPWESAEKIVINKSPITDKTLIAKTLNNDKYKYLKALKLTKDATQQDMLASYNLLSEKYEAEINDTENAEYKEIKMFYKEQLTKVNDAKMYFNKNKLENKQENKQQININTDCKQKELKNKIAGAIETLKMMESATKEDMIKTIESIINKY